MADKTLYGIKNCDTVKRAVQWLNEAGVAFDFHDYKSKGITEAKLEGWSKKVGWENLLNRRGLTWKQLPENVRNATTTEKAAITLMLEKNSIIKRPLIETGDRIILGFDESEYREEFL